MTTAGHDARPPTDEASLWQAWRLERSTEAREKLFSLHVAFAKAIARRRYLRRTGGDIELPDLCQMAYAGLLEAIDKYDPASGAPFQAYAARRVSGSILDGIAKVSELREQLAFRKRARRERTRSLSIEGADDLPTAAAMQSLVDVAVGLAIGFMLEGTGAYRTDAQADQSVDAYETMAWRDTLRRLEAELGRLRPNEEAVIRHHYVNGLTFDQIGAVLGVTKGRVSQIHRAAIERLREQLPLAHDFRLRR